MIGQTVSVYRILSKLGEGAMSIVYLAKDKPPMNRNVAIKMLKDQNDSRLLREANAISQINHPNIAHIYEYGKTDDGHSFIVMEYIEGETLADILKRKSLSVSRTIEIIAAVASALSEAHSKGIIHRDIKPSNIIINKRGEVKVVDFGLAKQIESFAQANVSASVQAYGDETQTSEHKFIGTPLYASPEQANIDPIDERSDIFSLGIVFYECLTRQNPFQDENHRKILTRISRDEPVLPSQINTDISKELDEMVLKALAKNIGQRYQTAREFCSDLRLSNFNKTMGESPFTELRASKEDKLLETISTDRANTKGDYVDVTSEGRKPKIRVFPPFRLLLLFVLMFSVIAALIYPYMTRVRKVAVLPIINEQSDPTMDYLSDGITDRVITKLSRLSQVKVKAFTTVSVYKGSNVAPQKVGQELGVDFVLSSRMRQQGDLIIVKTELIDANDGTVKWKEEIPTKSSELLSLEERIAQNVYSHSTSSIWINKEEQENLTQKPTQNAEAYKQYLRGRYFWRKRDADNIRKAIALFESAIELDPAFANAHAGLADCYIFMNNPAYNPIATREAMEKAKAAAKDALAIDPNSFEALTSIGAVNLRYDWNFIEAEQNLKRAIELNPDYAPAHFWYSYLHAALKHFDEAIKESKIAKTLDPLSPNSELNVGRMHNFARRYDGALSIYNKLLATEPNYKHAKFMLGLTYVQMGNYSDAIQTLEALHSVDPSFAPSTLGFAYARAGNRQKAQKILDELQQQSNEKGNVSPFEFALVYAGLNDKDKTFELLHKAIDERFFSAAYIDVEPLLDDIRTDPRYPSLIQKINIKP